MAYPFLKWAGGKRWAAPEIVSLAIARGCVRAVEPFLGGGATTIEFAARTGGGQCLGGDVNADLIDLWCTVRDSWDDLDNAVRRIPVTPEAYYRLRSSQPQDRFERAVRLLYLNRGCYGGLYRVNGRGEFNVPWGFTYDRQFLPVGRLESASAVLRRSTFVCADFVDIVAAARKGDAVFMDPPYARAEKSDGGFRRFSTRPFAGSRHAEAVGEALAAANIATLVAYAVGGSEVSKGSAEVFRAEGWSVLVARRSAALGHEEIWVSPAV